MVVIGLVAAFAAGGGAFGWRFYQNAGVVRAARPATPDLRQWPDELQQRVAAANRDTAGALAELSRLYHANGFLGEAARCYTALEKLQPREPRWPHRHATILAGYGDLEPAIARWQRVTTLAPEYLPARLRLGDALTKAENSSEAASVFTEALQRKPDEPYAVLGLARIDLEAGRWEAARQRLETVAAQTGNELGADLLVTVYEHFGQQDRASAVRAKAKAAGTFRDLPDPWIDELVEVCFDAYRLSLAAGLASRSGDRTQAAKLLERAVALAPDDVTIRFQLASVHADAGNLAAARTHFERCTTAAPGFPDAWAHLSALLQRGGDARGAELVLLNGLRNCPESPGLHLMRARQLRDGGRAAEAIPEYRASIRFRPNEADAYLELATTLFRLERVPEGLAALDGALAAEPNHPAALALRAFHAITERKEADARKWLGAVLNQPRVPREQVEQLLAGFREHFGRPFR
jgi:tetratricopeptide (TPR) repeat protein